MTISCLANSSYSTGAYSCTIRGIVTVFIFQRYPGTFSTAQASKFPVDFLRAPYLLFDFTLTLLIYVKM